MVQLFRVFDSEFFRFICRIFVKKENLWIHKGNNYNDLRQVGLNVMNSWLWIYHAERKCFLLVTINSEQNQFFVSPKSLLYHAFWKIFFLFPEDAVDRRRLRMKRKYRSSWSQSISPFNQHATEEQLQTFSKQNIQKGREMLIFVTVLL